MSDYSKKLEEVFVFTKSYELLRVENTCIFLVPPNIFEKKELMDLYYNGLWMVELGYFGKNWDALVDITRDFSWIPKEMKQIVIFHLDLPIKKKEDQKNYLEILAEAVENWRKNPNGSEYTKGPHEFIVVFPPECRERIEEALN